MFFLKFILTYVDFFPKQVENIIEEELPRLNSITATRYRNLHKFVSALNMICIPVLFFCYCLIELQGLCNINCNLRYWKITTKNVLCESSSLKKKKFFSWKVDNILLKSIKVAWMFSLCTCIIIYVFFCQCSFLLRCTQWLSHLSLYMQV